MHDDHRAIEWRLARVVRERIAPAIFPRRHPLVVTAWHAPGEPPTIEEALAATYEPFAVGDRWGRPWATTWLRLDGVVSSEWVGRRVEAVIDLGFSNQVGFQAEGLLWSARDDGSWSPWRGLHPLNHRIPVTSAAAGGEKVQLLVEAAANPTLTAHLADPNGDPTTAGRDPIYRLAEAELRVVDSEVEAYREDIRTLVSLWRELPGDQPRGHEILRALERSLDVLVLDDVAATAASARAELTEVLARPAHASAHRISAIGHAHIDSAWLWPLRETVRKCSRTFSNVLRLMEDYPEFRFGCSQAVQYQWMADRFPHLFEEITQRVAEGRWIPLGGMWVEADVNLAGGEALIRQFTHGQRFFEQHFGFRCTEMWLPDVFGYPASLPQIMRIAGIGRFLTQKLSWNATNRFPHHTFWWEGIDGSTVFSHFPPVETYNATFDGRELAHAVRTFRDKGAATRSLMPFGWGDGGGGPTRQMLEQFRRVRDLEGSPRVEIETPEVFFDAAIAEYPDAPRWVGELYFEKHRGTFTSQAATKAGNRRCELLLREAELWATLAADHALSYPAQTLDRLWKVVLLHQFHDILPGSSIAWVHDETEAAHGEVVAECESIIADSLAALSAGDDAAVSSPQRRRGVANAAPHDRHEVVVFDDPAVHVADVTQLLSDGRVAAWIDAPALGFGSVGPAGDVHDVVTGERSLSNGLVSITLDDDGLISSIRDHRHGDREVVAPGRRANLLQIHPDLPNEFDAWDLDESYRHQVVDLCDGGVVEVLDDGPLIGRIRITRSVRSSGVSQILELRAGSARLDVRCEVDWHERDHVLKVAFPLDVPALEMRREIQFGHVSTPIHTNTSWDTARFEVCAHRWVDVAEMGYGVAVLNDSKYGYDASRTRDGAVGPATSVTDSTVATTTVRLTLLRGAQYPDPFADEGRHDFTYSLLPHGGDLAAGQVVEEGYRLNIAPRVLPGAAGTGQHTAIVGLDTASVVIEAVKRADDGSGDVIVRCYEAHGARVAATLVTGFDFSQVQVTDVYEMCSDAVPVVPLDVDVAAHSLGFEVRPFQILTLRFCR